MHIKISFKETVKFSLQVKLIKDSHSQNHTQTTVIYIHPMWIVICNTQTVSTEHSSRHIVAALNGGIGDLVATCPHVVSL
jgi:hypothetical protein